MLGLHLRGDAELDLRGDSPPCRGSGRRPGPGQRPRATGGKPGHAVRRRRVQPDLLQLDDHLDRHRPAAGAVRPAARGPERRGRGHRGGRCLSRRMPTYITLKDVKKRWGHGQEDVFPVAQFEKLWSDMTVLPDARCRFVVVPRLRGQQLKEQAQLDSWLRDGSAEYVDTLCAWEE